MIPLVLGVIFRAIAVGSIFQASGSESTKTGRAPQYVTALAVATKVKEGTNTSLPGWTFRATRAVCSATVPLAQAIEWRVSQNSRKLDSKSSIYFPLDEIQPESRQSNTYSRSWPTSAGAETGMKRRDVTLGLQRESSGPLPSTDDRRRGGKQPGTLSQSFSNRTVSNVQNRA